MNRRNDKRHFGRESWVCSRPETKQKHKRLSQHWLFNSGQQKLFVSAERHQQRCEIACRMRWKCSANVITSNNHVALVYPDVYKNCFDKPLLKIMSSLAHFLCWAIKMELYILKHSHTGSKWAISLVANCAGRWYNESRHWGVRRWLRN